VPRLPQKIREVRRTSHSAGTAAPTHSIIATRAGSLPRSAEDGGATAAIGYVHEAHACLLPQQLHREVADAAGSYRCVA
jgi:hypothetical protein